LPALHGAFVGIDACASKAQSSKALDPGPRGASQWRGANPWRGSFGDRHCASRGARL